ncbi:MAG: hypothetical protein H8D62_00035 [Bacteroidetes bacterium]|nr:hypothetical protein [Bacteroidota bacterium]
MRFYYILGIGLSLLLGSCSTARVAVNVQRPANITIPHHIQNVVIANRSLPAKENRGRNILEGFLSGEGIGADKQGSAFCVTGLSQMLSANERFTATHAAGLELYGTGTDKFPPLLNWKEVNSICETYNADALIVLETFDSDSRTFLGEARTRYKKVDGVKVPYTEYPAFLSMEIESGWRIYDATNRRVIDENKFIEVKEFKKWGGNPEDARRRLPSPHQALREAGIFAGEQYGFRIAPIWISVSRSYYINKHDDFKTAKSAVKRGDWETAMELWKGLAANADSKIANQACYNMALASEVSGNLSTAIEWAKKSRKRGNKKANSYIRILQNRQLDQKKLAEQLH